MDSFLIPLWALTPSTVAVSVLELPSLSIARISARLVETSASTRDQLTLADSLRNKMERLRDNTYAGQKATAKAERLRVEMNRVAFRALNKNDGKSIVDLHGLDVKGAEDKVTQKVTWARKVRKKTLRFIVGQGRHSDGSGVLKWRVQALLKRKKVRVATINVGGILLAKIKP
ncbi:unnamed protein product [Peniophora sp. CBMAI 1063]|nr:unnamed protein product [Peniophora sp. CBMAI 1063]